VQNRFEFKQRKKIMSTTFLVDDVELANNLLEEKPVADAIKNIILLQLEAYQCNAQSLIETKQNAFVMAIHYAFDEHRPLILSPDHIWLLLAQGFAHHARTNAEGLRHLFVAHKGKLELLAQHPKLQRGTRNAWEEIIPQFSQKIRAHIGADIHDVLTPKFSTTSPIESFAYESTLMNAMSAYFDYSATRCGIPSITLEGTNEDWQLILKQIQTFRDYELNWWVDALEPILKEFVSAREGEANRNFWKNIYKQNNMSGGPFITGWITNFFPYLGEENAMKPNPIFKDPGYNHIKLDDIPNGLTTATVHCDDGSQKWDATIKTGFFGISQNKESLALRPEIAWAVRDETAIEEGRKAQRMSKRTMTDLPEPEHCFFILYPYTIEFADGAYEIHPRKYVDGKLMKEKTQEDATSWVEIEYEILFYRYNSKILSREEAMELIELHEKSLRYLEDGLTKVILIH
jgi:hypothetical protein